MTVWLGEGGTKRVRVSVTLISVKSRSQACESRTC